jgi:hypothetical protein
MLESIAVFPLTVPILTGLLALLGSWLGAVLGRKTEHAQWKRDQKVKAYADFLEAAKPFDIESLGLDSQKHLDSLTHDTLRVQMLGSEKVYQAAREVHRAMAAVSEMIDDIPIKDKEEEAELGGRVSKLRSTVDHFSDAVRRDLRFK